MMKKPAFPRCWCCLKPVRLRFYKLTLVDGARMPVHSSCARARGLVTFSPKSSPEPSREPPAGFFGGLGRALEELERTDPEVRAAAERYDAVSTKIRGVSTSRAAVYPTLCAWVEDGIPCYEPLPYPGAAGHGHLCDRHVSAELALLRAQQPPFRYPGRAQVHVPPCDGCGNPESCGACWMKLSREEQQKLLGGGRVRPRPRLVPSK